MAFAGCREPGGLSPVARARMELTTLEPESAMPPSLTASAPPRYSRRPFPPYRFLPGSRDPGPHPRTDPAGHAYGDEDEYLAGFGPDDWAQCEPYLYGVDLFNHGYWWEAHEAWEAVWLAAGQRATRCGSFVQGLIQLAGAQLKRCVDERAGAESLTAAAGARLLQADGVYLGVDAPALVEEARRCLREDRGEYPRIVLRFACRAGGSGGLPERIQ